MQVKTITEAGCPFEVEIPVQGLTAFKFRA